MRVWREEEWKYRFGLIKASEVNLKQKKHGVCRGEVSRLLHFIPVEGANEKGLGAGVGVADRVALPSGIVYCC